MTDRPLAVHWRVGRPGGPDLPPLAGADSWLSPEEREGACGLRAGKRRDDWLTGRLNLKALLVHVLARRGVPPPAPRDLFIDRRAWGAPCVRLAAHARAWCGCRPGDRLPVSVSSSHSNGCALGAAVWTAGGSVAVGADLEWIEPRSDAFVRDFLNEDEQAHCAEARGPERDRRTTRAWSVKEAVLKALEHGLGADTCWLTCLPGDPPPDAPVFVPDPGAAFWQPLIVECDPRLDTHGLGLAAAWREIDGFIATLAVGVLEGPAFVTEDVSAPAREPALVGMR
jgi:4'-phosphopantetheinyl transferase